MPQFTQWQIVDPTPNVMFNPMAIDESIAKQRSELGNLDINQQRLQLERDKLAQQREAGAALLGGGDTAGTGTAGGGGGGGGSFLDALASIESGDKNIVSGVDKDSRGLTLAQGGNPTEISQGHFQIQTATWRDFAKQAGVDVNQYPTAMSAPREVQAQVASVIPLSRFGPRTQTLLRSRFGPLDTNQTVGALAGTPALTFAPGTSGPRVTTVPTAPTAPPPPPFNPYAGPRVVATPAPAAGTATDALGFDPLNPMRGAPSVTGGAPTVTGHADPASMEAVKKASVALLAMPEAEAAVAYGPTVRALQAQGLAMNAPPVYPGHAALQAIVGQAETPPAVEPSRLAMRLGGTDTAGPGAGPVTMGPVEQPNTLYQTGLPGVSIRGPGNALAPPVAAAPATAPPAPVTAPAGAAPPGRPVVPPPPVAPSRVIGQEPLIQSGPAAGLTDGQRRIAAAMVAGGTPVADVGAHMAQWRQLNVANQQQAATNAALTAQAQFERFKYEQEQKIAAEQTAYTRGREAQNTWEPLGNGMERNKLTGETKYAGPPSARMATDAQGNLVQANTGGPGVTVVSPADPAAIATRKAAEAQGTGVGQDVAKQMPALVAQGREATQAIGNIDYGMSQLEKARQGGITTGYFADALATTAARLKSLGVPTDKIPFINVDPSAVGNIQTAQKTLAIVSSAILKQALGDSQITDAKIQHFIHAQPGIETDPQALGRVLNWARSQFVYENEMSRAAVAEAANSPTGTLPLNWQAKYFRDKGFAPIYDRGTGEMQQPEGRAPTREPPPGPPATAPINPSARTLDMVYQTPKGPLKWTSDGWVAP